MRFLLILLIIYIIYQLLKGLLASTKDDGSRKHESLGKRQSSGGEDLVEDPNCHTYIPISNAYKVVTNGTTLYFCSKRCRDAYVEAHSPQAKEREAR